MSKYYELIKESKPKNRAKKIVFDPLQNVYFASCHNYLSIEILGEASGLLLTMSNGDRTLEDIVNYLSSTFNVSKSNVEEMIVVEVRNLQRKHLLYLEV